MFERIGAGFTHLYTISGGIVAFFTLIAITQERYQLVFLLFLVATVIDASDGYLARRFSVEKTMPWIDGKKMDLIADFVNVSFLPVFLLWNAGLLPTPSWLWASMIIAASIYYWSQTDPLTEKWLFRGTPPLWNFYSFYIFHFELSGSILAAVISILLILTVSPIKSVHIGRTKSLNPLMVSLGGIFFLLYFLITMKIVGNEFFWLSISLIFPGYYIVYTRLLYARYRKGLIDIETLS